MKKPTPAVLAGQDRAGCPQLAVRPGWHGPCHQGHAKCMKTIKRREARQRDLAMLPERRKKHPGKDAAA